MNLCSAILVLHLVSVDGRSGFWIPILSLLSTVSIRSGINPSMRITSSMLEADRLDKLCGNFYVEINKIASLKSDFIPNSCHGNLQQHQHKPAI